LLVELLESFSNKELEGLRHIAASAYFNTDKYVMKLLEVLIKHILGKSWTPEAAQTRLFNKVFSNSSTKVKMLDKKQKAKLNAKMSLLTRLAERFLRMEALENSQSNRCELLMESLLEKKQYRLFNKHLAKERKSIENDPKDFFYFKKLHLFEEEEFNYLTKSGNWVKSNNIKTVILSLDLWYLSKKFIYTIAEKNLIKQNSDPKKKSSILELIGTPVFKNCGYEKYPIFTLQLAVLQLMSSAKYNTYRNLLNLLQQNELKITRAYLIQFYTIAVNYCTHQIKLGKTAFFKHFVDLHKLLDRKQLLLLNNSIPTGKLINIVVHGCKIGDFEWVLKMIKKYTLFIDSKNRINVESYNLGYVAFEKGNYKEAINFLLEVENFNKSYDINKRIIILKSYYELEEHYSEPTAQLFRSLETFIKKHKLLANKDKITYKTFIRIFYNIYRIKHQVGTISLDKIKDRIENAEFISNKLWLLEKIEELERRK